MDVGQGPADRSPGPHRSRPPPRRRSAGVGPPQTPRHPSRHTTRRRTGPRHMDGVLPRVLSTPTCPRGSGRRDGVEVREPGEEMDCGLVVPPTETRAAPPRCNGYPWATSWWVARRGCPGAARSGQRAEPFRVHGSSVVGEARALLGPKVPIALADPRAGAGRLLTCAPAVIHTGPGSDVAPGGEGSSSNLFDGNGFATHDIRVACSVRRSGLRREGTASKRPRQPVWGDQRVRPLGLDPGRRRTGAAEGGVMVRGITQGHPFVLAGSIVTTGRSTRLTDSWPPRTPCGPTSATSTLALMWPLRCIPRPSETCAAGVETNASTSTGTVVTKAGRTGQHQRARHR